MVSLESHAMLAGKHAVMIPVFVPAPPTLRMESLPELPEGFMRFGRGEIHTLWTKEVKVYGKTFTMQRVWVSVWGAIISETITEGAAISLRIDLVDQSWYKGCK